jgi:hypothetical protein
LISRTDLIGRQSAREAVTIPVAMLVESEGETIPHPSRMVDVSVWGTRLKTRLVVPPGLRVRVASPKGPAFAVPAKVVWSRRPVFGEEAEVGLEFLQPISPHHWWGLGSRRASH